MATGRVAKGTRVGFWKPGSKGGPFQCKGFYEGPILEDVIIGQKMEQPLLEGTVKFRVGCLFRPDLNRRQRVETILILENVVDEMWEYEDWDAAAER